jgi:hypothetical membrane protein
MNASSSTPTPASAGNPARISAPAAWLALITTTAALLLLASLHFLSPEFDPSWRMISEYAFGHHASVMALMFLCWGVGAWALALALRSEVCCRTGRTGLVFLVIAGMGEALASVYDANHEVGHGIAGFLGVLGFPVAAMLLTVALRGRADWQPVGRTLFRLASLCWISVVLLIASLAVMTMQMFKATGGHLPQHAPKILPPGVLPLAGWADRLIVVSYCAWVLVAAWHAIRLRRATA